MCKRRFRVVRAWHSHPACPVEWKNMLALTTFGDDGLFGLPEYPDVDVPL
jgi:hypothetical protein